MSQQAHNKQAHIHLAPMEGVVDPWIRQILTSFGGIDYCVTEFIRVTSRLNPENVFYRYAPELYNNSRTLSGTPVFIQLLGSDLSCMGENAALACELGAYGIDINFGCPAKTVNRHDGGSVILKDPERVFQITQAVRKAVPQHIPVNAKVRLGFEHKDFHVEIAQAAEAAGAGWLTVHARTKLEAYRPPAHWEYIARMKNSVKIPVIANGDIWTEQDYLKCREVSGCEDVMLGRGLMADPCLALKIRKTLNPQNHQQHSFTDDLSTFYVRAYLNKYFEICENREERFLSGRMKQLVKLLSRDSAFFTEIFQSIKRLPEPQSIFHEISRQLELKTSGQAEQSV